MDSTFMGVLAGVACLIKARPQLTFQLTHLSKKNQDLLITLGVNRVLDYHLASDPENPEPDPEPQLELSIETNTKITAETSLEAHQKLADIDAKNRLEFKSVIELLQADLDQLKWSLNEYTSTPACWPRHPHSDCSSFFILGLLAQRKRYQALAAEHRTLVQEKEAALGFVQNVGSVFADAETVEMTHLLERVLHYAVRTCKAGSGAIYLRDNQKKTLSARALSGVMPPLFEVEPNTLQVGPTPPSNFIAYSPKNSLW